MFETLKQLFTKRTEPNVIVITSGDDYSELPNGFFTSLGGNQRQVGFHCPECAYTVKFGAQNGVTHCGRHVMPPPADVELPTVRWVSAPRAGTMDVGGGRRIIDTDSMPGTFDGDVGWDGDPYSAARANDLSKGLW